MTIKRSLEVPLFCLGLLVALMGAARPAHAVLGEPADSIASDRKAMAALRSATTVRNGYTVEEVVSQSTTVREYIAPSGIVFGIAWNGLVHPDLSMLLGSYSGEYQKALQQPRIPGQRYRRVKANGVVVEKWGHMRNLQGRAYAPALIPQGVNVDDIK